MSDKDILGRIKTQIDQAFSACTDLLSDKYRLSGIMRKFDYKSLTANEHDLDLFVKEYLEYWEDTKKPLLLDLKEHKIEDAEGILNRIQNRTYNLLKERLQIRNKQFDKKHFLTQAHMVASEELGIKL